MCYKTIRFSLADQPTASHFARPRCETAYIFCLLTRKKTLSVSDLLFIQDIGFCVKISAEKK
jgi:hypothetical protein